MLHSFPLLLLLLSLLLGSSTLVAALGSSCQATGPLGPGTAAPNDPYWLQTINHQGTSAYNPNPGAYKVYRNVKDFGAKGDGVTDDTAAINAAIASGGRCGGGNCGSSTITPAVVFFPKGTYLVSSPIIAYYYTQLIGDAKAPPTLLSTPGFNGIAIIDADPYLPGGAQWYTNQNNFFRSVRNFVIDLRPQPPGNSATGLHWQVSQATSLMNIVVRMSTQPGNNHQGIFMENGSGGFMGDLVFLGGRYGMWVGNQQFTVRNITIRDAGTAVYGSWNWGWTFQNFYFANCGVGFDLSDGVQAEAMIDGLVVNTPIFIRLASNPNGHLTTSLVLNNIQFLNVPHIVAVNNGPVILVGVGGKKKFYVGSWGQGNVYSGANPAGTFTQGNIAAPPKPAGLMDGTKIFGRTHPQYLDYAVSQFVSVKDHGAEGDGATDDTAALQAVFNTYAGCKIIFFDAGTYIVTSTLTVPEGTQMVGEAWTVIAGKGAAFQDVNNPQVVVRVGAPGSVGVIEITDIIFSTVGPAPGAIVVEWNIHQSSKGSAGMWDSHIRLGGTAGTQLGASNCLGSGVRAECFAAFMALHLTPASTAYLEGTWIWLADHDLDSDGQLSIFSGRGVLSESAGPVWMIGVAEHHTLYQFNLQNAKDHYMGLIQTESPYYQPVPAAPAPFQLNPAFHDPTFIGTTSSWALWTENSDTILVFGAGLYSFFQSFSTACLQNTDCQSQLLNVDGTSKVNVYSLQTVGTTYQASINQVGIINQNQNRNGFAATVTFWKSI